MSTAKMQYELRHRIRVNSGQICTKLCYLSLSSLFENKLSLKSSKADNITGSLVVSPKLPDLIENYTELSAHARRGNNF